jgi:hypothetical protein
MMTTVPGVYRNGKIELTENPGTAPEGSQVFVTFLSPVHVDLRSLGIDEEQAAEQRWRFAAFAEDWDSPEMDIYDRYDAVKAGH